MNPKDCTRFPTCNANICPLDADWRKRSHVPGEEACQVMLELVKPGADARFESRIVMMEIRPHAQALLDALRDEKERRGELVLGRGALLSQIDAAATTGSTWDRNAAFGERMRAARMS